MQLPSSNDDNDTSVVRDFDYPNAGTGVVLRRRRRGGGRGDANVDDDGEAKDRLSTMTTTTNVGSGGGGGGGSGIVATTSSQRRMRRYASDYQSLLMREGTGRDAAGLFVGVGEDGGGGGGGDGGGDGDGDDDDDGGGGIKGLPGGGGNVIVGVLGYDYDRAVAIVDNHFRRIAAGGLVAYALLVLSSYLLCPSDRIVLLEETERNAAAVASIVLSVVCICGVVPLLYHGLRTTTLTSTSNRALSGIIVGAVVVQACAALTDFAMAALPTPVMIDPVTGTRVHLLRWCEWTPLAFVMTFLTVGTDVPDGTWSGGRGEGGTMGRGGAAGRGAVGGKGSTLLICNLRNAYLHATAQGLSTLCGLIFPFCPGPISWWFFMLISWALFLCIFGRLRNRIRAFREAVSKHGRDQGCGGTSGGGAAAERFGDFELHRRAHLSLKLLVTCAVMWSTLVTVYVFSVVAPRFAPRDSKLADPALTMLCECVLDVVAKAIYMTIIVDVHKSVFDQNARTERRLGELRQMMDVVWDNSSDVIGISVRDISGTVTTMLSPTFLEIYGDDSPETDEGDSSDSPLAQRGEARPRRDGADAIVFELDADEFEHGRSLTNTRSGGDGDGDGDDDDDDDDAKPARGGANPAASARLSSKSARKAKPRVVYSVDFNSAGNARGMRSGGWRNILRKTRTDKVDASDVDGQTDAQSTENKACGNVVLGADSPEHRPRVSAAEISPVADLIVRAWDVDRKETMLMDDFVRVCGFDKRRHSIRCEAKVTKLDENALVVVMRDISERFRRFEAEKRAIGETTARQKDAEANRFTRHEVKNGLLAAIGLCDSLRDTMTKELLAKHPPTPDFGAASPARAGAGVEEPSVRDNGHHHHLLAVASLATTVGRVETGMARCLDELDKTLHEILDTVLAEAMARDVMHELYEPKLERVDICAMLCGSSFTFAHGNAGNERFPLITQPSPLPVFAFDPQLFKYIHRNAVSNACKHGKKGGMVMTEIRFNEDTSMLEMDVINLPGERHDKLIKMGRSASEAVFYPRRRLRPDFENNFKTVSSYARNFLASHSSGDRAWIMHKCAKILGGEVDIRFESNRTVFSLRCPATPFDVAMKMATSVDPTHFKLPDNIWGIAIDDSKIQRKLLERFFVLAGVRRERCIILGKDADEIKTFEDFVLDHIDLHPDDMYFVIADENLDLLDDADSHVTVSGSSCIENIRHHLLPEQERRMLALVRSANDSSHDVAIYNSRAHGFLPKAPIQRDRILETLAPIWEKRYPKNILAGSAARSSGNGVIGNNDEQGKHDEAGTRENGSGESPAEDLISLKDLMGEVDDVDSLCSECTDAALASRWPRIWEKLHLLKGDLKSLPSSGRASAAVEMINALQGPTLPPNFRCRWQATRALVVSIRFK